MNPYRPPQRIDSRRSAVACSLCLDHEEGVRAEYAYGLVTACGACHDRIVQVLSEQRVTA